MKKAYYAHCMSIYGTPQEERDIATIVRLGFDIVNPNAPEHESKYREFCANGEPGMDYFTGLIDSECDLIIFRANPDGSIPAGVAKEVAHAKTKDMVVIELPSSMSRRTLSVTQTREWLQESGQR